MQGRGLVNYDGTVVEAELLLRLHEIDVYSSKPRGIYYYTIHCRDGTIYAKAPHIAPILRALGIPNPWTR